MGLKFSLNKIFLASVSVYRRRSASGARHWSRQPEATTVPLAQTLPWKTITAINKKKTKPSLGEDQDSTWHDFVQLFLSRTISKIVQSIGQEIRNLFLNLGRKLLIVLSSLIALLAIWNLYVKPAISQLFDRILYPFHLLGNWLTGVGHRIAHGAGWIGHGLVHGASFIGHGLGGGARALGHGAVGIGHGVAHGAASVGHGLGHGAQTLGHGVGWIGHGIVHGVSPVVHGVSKVIPGLGFMIQ